MKQQAKKYKYFQTLFDSIKIIFKNPRLFVPYAVMFLSMTIFTMLIDWMEKEVQFSLITGKDVAVLAISAIISIILIIVLSFFIAGWSLSVLNQYIHTNKFSLKTAFKRSFSFAGRAYLITLIFILFIIASYFAIYALSLAASAIGMSILSFFIGLIFVCLLIIFIIMFVQLTPVLVVEDKGIIETIRTTINFYLRKKLYSLNIFLVSMLFGAVLAIPSLAYMIYLFFNQMIIYGVITPMNYTLTERIIIAILQIPIYVGSAATIVYYCISYKIKKATIKQK